jgi:hypothetical protein
MMKFVVFGDLIAYSLIVIHYILYSMPDFCRKIFIRGFILMMLAVLHTFCGLALNYNSIFQLNRRKVLVWRWENLKERDRLEPRCGWENNIETDRKALGWDGTD